MCEPICMATAKTTIVISADDLITVPQAAKDLGVHFATVYRWIEKGKIHPIRIAGQVYLAVADVKRLKNRNVNKT